MGLGLMGSHATKHRVKARLKAWTMTPAAISCEWMVHPGFKASSGDDFNQSPDRVYEFHILQSEWLAKLLAKFNIELKSFSQVKWETSLEGNATVNNC